MAGRSTSGLGRLPQFVRSLALPATPEPGLTSNKIMPRGVLGMIGVFGITLLSATPSDYLSVQHKFSLIESGNLKAGSRIRLTPAELNAYVAHQVPMVTGGVRNPALRLVSPGIAEGTAVVDFAEIQRSQGNPPGWLMSKLLEGEHPVSVTARIRSAAGQATVDVLSVQISGLTIDGRTLDFLIQHFLLPLYPDAAVGRPFELGDRIEKLDVQPTGVGVWIGR